jgi:predicted dehydrogenase/sugar phosphate isomerase/epimerase
MFPSIFTDELGVDITDALPILRSWGLEYVDLRTQVFGACVESLSLDRLAKLRGLLDSQGFKVGCIQSSLAKYHLPDKDRQNAETDKLEGIIRAADALDCRLVRAFFFWQPPKELEGELAVRPDEQQKVLDMFAPLAKRAQEAGLIFGFENCGVTPDEVFTILDALGIASWGLAWDVHNTWDCDERRRDEHAYILRMVQRARMVHVKATGAVEGLGAEMVPYDKVLRACDNAGVRGPVSAETHNPDRSVSNVDMSKRVVEAIKKAWPTAAPGGLFEAPRSAEGLVRPWAEDPVRFVVVGLGMGHVRSKEITETPGTRLVGVCDLIEERAKRTSEECSVPYTTDLREWLDNDAVEVVYVLTETGRHAQVGLQALEAGKHVLTTKPMAASIGACDELIRLAEKNGLLLGVDLDRRFKTDTQTLKAAVAKGRFGRLLSGNCSLKLLRTMDYYRANGGWRGTRRWDGGGVLSNQSVHHIDEIAFTVGIPAKVRCSIWTQTHEIEAEDLGVATWLYEDGMVITFQATSSYPHATWYLHFELEGTEGAYSLGSAGPLETPRSRWYIDGAWSDRPPEVVKCEWISAADNFAAALRTGAQLTCSGRDGRRTQAILDGMYRSAYDVNGGWVDVHAELA